MIRIGNPLIEADNKNYVLKFEFPCFLPSFSHSSLIPSFLAYLLSTCHVLGLFLSSGDEMSPCFHKAYKLVMTKLGGVVNVEFVWDNTQKVLSHSV